MEPIEIFTASVLVVGAFHLVATAGTHVLRWWNEMLPQKNFSMQQRNDWYVFFHCSDLVGRQIQQEVPQIKPCSVISVEKRKQQVRRPTLRVDVR